MQYMVSKIQGKEIAASGESKIFETIPDVVKYLRKLNKSKRLLIGSIEMNEGTLQEALKQRLSSVSVFVDFEEDKKWIVVAF